MEGINILSTTPIMEKSDFVINIIITFFCISIVGLFCFFVFSICRIEKLALLSALIAILSIGITVVASTIKNKESGRYMYECLISEDVTLTEFYEKYNIVDVNGKIWTIYEKE